MEQLNSVTLRGFIGSARISEISGTRTARATIATNFTYKDRENNQVIETTWSNLTIFEGKKTADIGRLAKGVPVEVKGRLRNIRYTAADGSERHSTEILVSELTVIDENRLALQTA